MAKCNQLTSLPSKELTHRVTTHQEFGQFKDGDKMKTKSDDGLAISLLDNV